MTIKGDDVDWYKVEMIGVINKVVSNLQIARHCYKEASVEDVENNYFTAECEECGWYGSSKLLNGGGQIGMTGDFNSCTCPVCDNNLISEK